MDHVGAVSPSELYNSHGNHQESLQYDDEQVVANNNFLENFMASSLEFPFSTSTYEGDETYSYVAYSEGHQVVSFPPSNSSSLALHDQDSFLAIRNSDLYHNIECDHDYHHNHNHDHVHGQCVTQDIVNNGEPDIGIESHLERKRSSIYYDQSDKRKRNVKPRKNKKLASSDEESPIIQNNLYKEENSNGFTEESSLAVNLNGKTRASRGCATDPQSVYARKRRDKINERLRVLQNLVPNGKKVDISTMLEEAARYVEFLQLQIKALSSNDLWMYAPLSYNGMSIGFGLSDSITRQQSDSKP